MIKELLTIAKVKVWFMVVNRYKLLRAKRDLRAYEKTLSPKNREYAENLRRSLVGATPSQAAKILRQEAARLSEQQFRVIEKIDRAHL